MEKLWSTLCCLSHRSAWPVWWWVSDGLGRQILEGTHRPLQARKWHSDCHSVSGWNPWTHCQTLRWCSGSSVLPGACFMWWNMFHVVKTLQAVPGGWRNVYHWMVHTLACHISTRTPLGHCFGSSDAARLHLRLSRSSVMPCSRSGRKYPRTPSIVSLGACPDNVRHAYEHVGATQTTEYHFELLQKKLTSLLHQFLFWFSGCLWIQPSVGWSFSFPPHNAASFPS